MEKILVSACLLGDNVKYNGKNNYLKDIELLKEKYLIVPFCPEVEGGLKIPRSPAERKKDEVINELGENVTKAYLLGAKNALRLCFYLNIKKVVLKSLSPSCGKDKIYDGSFSHKETKRAGVTAGLLMKNDILVFDETEIKSLI